MNKDTFDVDDIAPGTVLVDERWAYTNYYVMIEYLSDKHFANLVLVHTDSPYGDMRYMDKIGVVVSKPSWTLSILKTYETQSEGS